MYFVSTISIETIKVLPNEIKIIELIKNATGEISYKFPLLLFTILLCTILLYTILLFSILLYIILV